MTNEIKINDWVYIKAFNIITKATPEILEMKTISKVPIISEYPVYPSVSDWDEIRLDFKLINKKFIKSLFPKFLELDFIGDCYVADNGLIRLCDIGNTQRLNPFFHRGVEPDICLHIKKGGLTIMRKDREGFKEKEDRIVDVICQSLNEKLGER